jgi:cysteine desulfurase/selenocysteine lyase
MINVKKDFPIFTNHPDLVYLDSAATSQKPRSVIDAVKDFYEKNNANIHRAVYDLSQQATDAFETARKKTADFIGAKDASEIIFTSGATEAINLVARGWARKFLQKGDVIVTSEMEHHSNIVPWLELRKEIGIEIIFLPITKNYRLDYKVLDKKAGTKIKLFALTHASNVLGTINPLETIIPYFRKKAPNAKILIDAAQSVPHFPVDVSKLDADFLAFSSHKMLGPSGVGVLYAKKELLEAMDPMNFGGHMIKKVTKEFATWADIPDKFEAGTRNIEGAIGLGAAIDYLQKVGMKNVEKHEQELTEYALKKFNKIGNFKLFGPKDPTKRLAVFAFAVGNVHTHDAAEILNRSNVAVRSGHHCAQLLLEYFDVMGTSRASLYLYNTKEDIDKLVAGIEEVKKTFRI